MFRLIIIFCTALLFSYITYAQDLEDYRWKNRLLIMVANDITHPGFALQIKELHKNTKGVNDRKLEVFHVTPEAYQIGIFPGLNWEKSGALYNQFKRPDTTFEIILIGLDGGVKARRTNFFSIKDLFTLIDAMPMRRAEIKKQ